MKICMVGTGYVGLVSGACFAEMGHEVVCVDIDAKKICNLRNGIIPFYEPGLEEIVRRNSQHGRLTFSTSLSESLQDSLFVFIAVGTPPDEDGSADLKHVLNVAAEVGKSMKEFKIIVNKSTVPVGTAKLVHEMVKTQLTSRGRNDIEFDVVSNPEFLKEGEAIGDFLKPDRIVIGVENPRTAELMKELYAPFVRNGHPVLIMDVRSSELTKYAANAMLAVRISFMNELAQLCDRVGADIEQIRNGIGSDSRIGMPFLYAGLGYGGSCFPKDVQALAMTMARFELPGKILKAAEEVNKSQRHEYIKTVLRIMGEDLRGKTFAAWGLSFKPGTDDMREAPSLTIIHELSRRGASFAVHDPESMKNAEALLPNERIRYCADMYGALDDADALLLITEWHHFRSPDFAKMANLMKNKIIFDGRNQYRPEQLTAIGFNYYSMGRGRII